MRAARIFATALPGTVARVKAELFGSLAATGPGHGSPGAVMLRLTGDDSATVDIEAMPDRIREIREIREIRPGGRTIAFDPGHDLVLHRRRSLPAHPNGGTFTAYADGEVLSQRTFFSIGGGAPGRQRR